MEYRAGPLEIMVINCSFWKDKKVFLTGHTGFKGGWIGLWLSKMGAKVHGFSLKPDTTPCFFEETHLESHLEKSSFGDIRNLPALTLAIRDASPSVVIHMAAQPLVLKSYQSPVETFETNVLGTVNLLEASRLAGTAKAIVIVTTDKCYEDRGAFTPFSENDRLGGYDPYSCSKACAELVSSTYRKSFFEETGIKLASARAGNVIGGGDWASDRLIPDFIKALDKSNSLLIRSPASIRPWQHVLEPLSGYLMLAEKLITTGGKFADAWNFGPEESDTKPVSWIADRLCSMIPNSSWKIDDKKTQRHETATLKLDSSKAKSQLNWSPRWSLETAIDKTMAWYNSWKEDKPMAEISKMQIESYLNS